MCVLFPHQLHHVMVARFDEQIPKATRVQQLVTRISKITLLQDVRLQTISASLGEH